MVKVGGDRQLNLDNNAKKGDSFKQNRVIMEIGSHSENSL